MSKILVVVDMQNDFIDGALGTSEAAAIVEPVTDLVKNWDGDVVFTRDTHEENYMDTLEGHNLPVPHCIRGTRGWELASGLKKWAEEHNSHIINKCTFGSRELGEYLERADHSEKIDEVVLVGLCTDICVISNAMIAKAFLINTPVAVISSCCAGVTPESHARALQAMAACQIEIR